MSRLNLESLNAVFVSQAIETLTFFYTPGEGKQNKKGEVSYDKKKEIVDKKKVDVPEEYLQIKRFEESDKQVLSFFLKDEKVADFIVSVQGMEFTTLPKWEQPKMYILIPTDPTFPRIVAEEVSGVFKKWLKTDRFSEYLERQAQDSKYTPAFVKLLILFFAWSENRDKEDEYGNITIIKEDVSPEAVAHSYLRLLTRLHNSSERTKKLFPVRPLLQPSSQIKEVTVESTFEVPIVEVVSESQNLETETANITTSPVDVIEISREPKTKKK